MRWGERKRGKKVNICIQRINTHRIIYTQVRRGGEKIGGKKEKNQKYCEPNNLEMGQLYERADGGEGSPGVRGARH